MAPLPAIQIEQHIPTKRINQILKNVTTITGSKIGDRTAEAIIVIIIKETKITPHA